MANKTWNFKTVKQKHKFLPKLKKKLKINRKIKNKKNKFKMF